LHLRFRIVYEVVMIQQVEIMLKPKSRVFHLVTGEIVRQLPKLPKTGIINIFCKHTSCGLSIYFCEYRNYGGTRRLVVTIIGE